MVGVVSIVTFAIMPQGARDRFNTVGDEGDTSTHRVEIWKQGIEMAGRRPLLGVGYANWSDYYLDNFPRVGRDSLLSHNIFVQVGAELGYTGLLAFLLMIAAKFKVNAETRRLARATPGDNRLPNGVEVQMLELDWVKLNKRDGKTPPIAYVHGELFGVGGVKIVPDNPRGPRSKSIENRCKPRGEWNTYDVVAVDGVVKLSVNGKFVNGVTGSTQKKGYLCLESEGKEIHFRNIRLMKLPPGVISPDQTAPVLE